MARSKGCEATAKAPGTQIPNAVNKLKLSHLRVIVNALDTSSQEFTAGSLGGAICAETVCWCLDRA